MLLINTTHSRVICLTIAFLVSLSRQCGTLALVSLSRQCSLVSAWECILQRVLWAAATHYSHHIWQCDTHNRGRTLWWMVNRLLVEYNLASLHCSWVCGHTASSSHVLTQLPPTVTSRASITFHVVHKPPVSTIKSSGTLHKHPTPHEYWTFPPLVWYNRQHWVSKRDHPKPKPHSNNPGCLKLASPTGLMQATTDTHSWGWT